MQPVLGIVPLLHAAMLAWVHFRQYVITQAPQLLAETRSLLYKLASITVGEAEREAGCVFHSAAPCDDCGRKHISTSCLWQTQVHVGSTVPSRLETCACVVLRHSVGCLALGHYSPCCLALAGSRLLLLQLLVPQLALELAQQHQQQLHRLLLILLLPLAKAPLAGHAVSKMQWLPGMWAKLWWTGSWISSQTIIRSELIRFRFNKRQCGYWA